MFGASFPPKSFLVATFKQTSALISIKYGSVPGKSTIEWPEKNRGFRLHFSFFALKNNLKMQSFSDFLPLRYPLVTTCNETRAATYRKYVGEQGVIMSNLL